MIEMDADLVKKIVEKGKRLDHRELFDYRKIEIENDVVTSAEGSARVRMGNTHVVAGIKMEIGTPFEDTYDEGVLIVNSELVPLASSEFESGPPSETSIELARVVDRTIRESHALDLKKLCIEEKEKSWMVFVDIDVLDYDGNLIDAACLAAVTALRNAKIPDLDEDGKPIYDRKGSKSLPLTGTPIATTFVKIGDKIIIDPTLMEYNASEARLTVGTVDVEGKSMLSAMQKGGSSGFSIDEIFEILTIAEKKGEELRELVK